MYLSKLTLDPRSRQVRSGLSNPYELHRTLMRAFPSAEGGGPGRVLFRLETPIRSAQTGLILLVQSEKEPDWPKLGSPNGYHLPDGPNNPKAFNPTFRPGQRLLFRLRANPTVKRYCAAKDCSKRVGLLKEEEQRRWLDRKAEEGGFKVLAANVTSEGKIGGKIRQPDQKTHDLCLLAVRFDGLLQVADPDRFLAALQKGVGSGKGLGFGLLSLAPA